MSAVTQMKLTEEQRLGNSVIPSVEHKKSIKKKQNIRLNITYCNFILHLKCIGLSLRLVMCPTDVVMTSKNSIIILL